jgi:hypothetical protein
MLIHSLSENRFQNVSAEFVQNFTDSRKKFICRPELLSLDWRRVLIGQTRDKKKSEGSKYGESGKNGGCDAIRMKLSSQNALITCAGYGLALPASATNFLSPLSTPSNDLGENISDIGEALNISPFGMAGMTWRQQLGIHGDSRQTLA